MNHVSPARLIGHKRDGARYDSAQIRAITAGIASGRWCDAQIAAFAMAVACRGMDAEETRDLTEALCDSGTRLHWHDLPGPTLDKHSTGGVGDCVSLLLAPLLAACGGYVPMISGRGLGHTGGTLDKLESIPGYDIIPAEALMRRVMLDAGCAIVGQSADLAPADRRLYAVRDVTATVGVSALMVASILSKKLAGGAQSLVLDVKVGSGAQLPDDAAAADLASRLLATADACGMRVRAAISDMNEVLGGRAGNALELRGVLDLLTGRGGCRRLRELGIALSAQLLQMGGLADDVQQARVRLNAALDSGSAAEHFQRMTAGLGASVDVLEDFDRWLPRAPIQRVVPVLRDGFVGSIDVRALGQAVVELGGGRSRVGQAIDHAVGLSELPRRGATVIAGQPLAVVHARGDAAASAAARLVQHALTISEEQPDDLPLLRWHSRIPAA